MAHASPLAEVLEPVLRASESRGLSAFLRDTESALADFTAAQRGFTARLTDYVLTNSGKRVRPGLVYVAGQFGNASGEAVLQTALAVEMIHIATLVHDDLVDEATLRRRKPTVGVRWGEGAAVLLGDFVYAQAFARLAGLGDPRLLKLFAETTLTMCEGEIGQLEARFQFSTSEEAYLEFLRKKTASLMAAACRAGAHLAGLSAPEQAALETFGDSVGMAFQIIDDILDIEGDEAALGKTLLTDITHGKMTLPLIYYARQTTVSAREDLFLHLRNPNGHLADLVRAVRKSGVLDRCRATAEGYVARAQKALAQLPDSAPRRLLSTIADRLSSRRS
jgi:geranylgeranyl pyrophosphate synthase